MNGILRLLPIAVLAAGLLAASCLSERKSDGSGERPTADPGNTSGLQESGERLDESSTFADPLKIQNLTVWPIIADKIRELGEFLTLGEAQTQGVAVVKEVGAGGAQASQTSNHAASPQQGVAAAEPMEDVQLRQPFQFVCGDLSIGASSSPAASVNTLLIENRGNVPILVCGGTVVKGGKQDRQIAQDLVIAPKTSTPVDAFCIEAHRWTESRDGEDTRGVFQAIPAVALQKVRSSAQYASNQHEVWANVSFCNESAGKSPATATLLATLEETDKDALAKRSAIEKAVREHFEALRAKGKRPVGFAYAVNGKPVTVRTFAHPHIFEGQFAPFVKTMCIEADLASRATKTAGGDVAAGSASTSASLKDVLALVHSINEEKEQVSATSAANKNGRRTNEKGGNSNCYVESPITKGELVPITRDWTSKN